MSSEKRKERLCQRERTGLKNPKEGYSSHLGYEAEALLYVRLFRFPGSYLTILHLIAVECLGGETTVSFW